MTNRELLEMAAKAAGISGEYVVNYNGDYYYQGNAEGILYELPQGGWYVWNPLTDDGDALRLATLLNMSVRQDDPNAAMAGWSNLQCTPITSNLMGAWYWKEWLRDHDNNRTAATRRAILRAAAQIGRSMA